MGRTKGHIRMTSILRGALAALAFTTAVWLAATPAAADDVDSCEKASGDEAIAACERAINSGLYSGRRLADLFHSRYFEWTKKQESDKAIADCSQPIRLEPNDVNAMRCFAVALVAICQQDVAHPTKLRSEVQA